MADFGKDQNSKKKIQRNFYRLGFRWKKNIKKNDHVYPVFIRCVKNTVFILYEHQKNKELEYHDTCIVS